MSEMTLTAAIVHLDCCSYADGDDVCGEAIRAVREYARATDPWAEVDRATSVSLARRVAELEDRLGIADDSVPAASTFDNPRGDSSLFRLTWRVHGYGDNGYCRVLGDAPDCHAAVRLDVDVDRHHVADEAGRPDFARIAHEIADALDPTTLTAAWAQHFEDTAQYAGGFTEPERAGIRAAARMMRDPNVQAQVAKTVGGES